MALTFDRKELFWIWKRQNVGNFFLRLPLKWRVKKVAEGRVISENKFLILWRARAKWPGSMWERCTRLMCLQIVCNDGKMSHVEGFLKKSRVWLANGTFVFFEKNFVWSWSEKKSDEKNFEWVFEHLAQKTETNFSLQHLEKGRKKYEQNFFWTCAPKSGRKREKKGERKKGQKKRKKAKKDEKKEGKKKKCNTRGLNPAPCVQERGALPIRPWRLNWKNFARTKTQCSSHDTSTMDYSWKTCNQRNGLRHPTIHQNRSFRQLELFEVRKSCFWRRKHEKRARKRRIEKIHTDFWRQLKKVLRVGWAPNRRKNDFWSKKFSELFFIDQKFHLSLGQFFCLQNEKSWFYTLTV